MLPHFNPAVSLKNRGRIAKAIYLLITTVVIYAIFYHWSYDDPYITYRYAENIQHGLGFVYNPGEKVLSTTTPLFALLLALLGPLGIDLPHLANLLGAFSLALGGIFLWDLAETWQVPLVGWSGLLLYPTFPLLVSTLGSETLLYLAFCLGAFAFYARSRYQITAVFTALTILTRPDGVLVAIILVVHYLFSKRHPIPWVALAIFLGLTLPWFIFAWGYFGSPLPVTLAVKQHQGAMAISQKFGPGLLTIFKPYFKWPYLLEAILLMAGLFFMFRQAHRWGLFLIWTLLYYLAYSTLGVSRYFWYYATLVPGFIVLIGLGVSFIRKKFAPNRTVPGYIFLMVLLVFLGLVQAYDLWEMRQEPDNRLILYPLVGEWLRDNTPSSASVGTLEVGIIGFYAQRRMIDFAGLINPHVSDQLTTNATYDDAALWAANYYHPDYLVLQDSFFPRLEQEYVTKYCESIQSFPGKKNGYPMDLYVYACK